MMRLATLRHIGRAMCIGASIRRVRKSPCDGLSAQSSHLPLSAPIPHIWLSHEQNCSLVAADRWPPSVATTGSRSAVPFSMRAPRNPRNSSSALKSLPKIHAPPVEAVEIRCKSKSESSSVESHSARVDANHPHPDQRAAPNLSARINEDSVTRNHVSATRAAVAIKKVKGEAVAGAASAAKKAIIDAAKKSQVGATSEAAAILKQSQPTASSVSSSLEQRIEIIEREIDKIGDEIAHVNSTLDQLLARRGTATDQGRLERDIANRRSETTQLWAKQSQLRTRKKELRNELLHVLKSAYLQRLADPLQLGNVSLN